MKKTWTASAAAALLATLSATAHAQSNVTVYGRLDLSVRQAADAVKQIELANGSTSRLGFRGVEDLGGGLKAVFDIQHRFNPDTGAQNNATRFWEGRSIVGLETQFGRFTLGREENPAYTYSQVVADPWGNDYVSSNTSIFSGRIGNTRYSKSGNYRFSASGFTVGAQIAQRNTNPTGNNTRTDKRPYSVGAAYANGPITAGVGFENPADKSDHWATVNGAYDLGVVKVGGLFGSGKNTLSQKHQSLLAFVTAPLGSGELRMSYGQLKNKASGLILDKQAALGYHYALSKRTTVYTDVVNERRDRMASNLKKVGWDVGIKHNF